jgi:hypothetical protein
MVCNVRGLNDHAHRTGVTSPVNTMNLSIVCDEGMPNGPSIFAYLVFGLGGTAVEGITRPVR